LHVGSNHLPHHLCPKPADRETPKPPTLLNPWQVLSKMSRVLGVVLKKNPGK
jgi:hypothetical protein